MSAPAFLTSNIVSYDPIANLGAPLDPLQIAGIWPVGDFRDDPDPGAAAKALLLVAILAAAATVAWALRRRNWAVPLYVCGAVGSALVLWAASTPWIEGKAFATAAPAIPFAAVLFGALLVRSGRVAEGVALGAIVVGGVLWSNVLQYHDVWLGPRDQLAELEQIGSRFAGDGPALQTEYQPYGVRHFLRRLDAEGASELRARPVPLRNGRLLDKGTYGEHRRLRPGSAAGLPDARAASLACREPPAVRLPARFVRPLVRRLAARRDVESVPSICLSAGRTTRRRAGLLRGRPACPGRGGPGGLRRRPPPVVVDVPAHGRRDGGGDGRCPGPGGYGIWMGGSFRDRLEAAWTARLVRRRHHLDYPGQYTQLGRQSSRPASTSSRCASQGGSSAPASGATSASGRSCCLRRLRGRAGDLVPAADARRLCGKRLDWIEALPRSS